MSYPTHHEKDLHDVGPTLAMANGDNVVDPTLADADLVQSAITAGEAETKLSLRTLMRIHYPAALWSMALSAALVMDGMDTGLVSGILARTHFPTYSGHTRESAGSTF